MRTVLTLPSQKKAVVDIPMSKLVPGGMFEKEMQETPCCESKIVVAGSNKKMNADLKRMVNELQEAYEKDMSQLTAKNDQLQAQKATLLNKHAAEISRISEEFTGKTRMLQGQIQSVRAENTRLQNEIRLITQEKDLILRSKISQFRQQEYVGRIAEQDQIIRLRQLEIKELLAKLQVAQVERARAQEQIFSNRLKLEAEISKLSLQLTESSRKYAAEHSTLSFQSKLREEDNFKTVQELRHQLQLAQLSLRESQIASGSKDRQIAQQTDIAKSFERQLNEVNRHVEGLKKQVGQLQAQLSSQKQSHAQLQKERLQLTDRLERSNQAVAFLDNEKGRLLLQLGQRLAECDRLRVQLADKQCVYQVKVQRVIDGKQRIDELQGVVFELQQQMKLLSQEKDYLAEDLKKRQGQIDQLASLRLKLQAEIAGLRAFITKREGSFRWTVEREIEKDLAVSGQNGQLYKVSQVGQFWREAQQQPNQFISEQIAMGMQANLFGHPQQIVLESNIQ